MRLMEFLQTFPQFAGFTQAELSAFDKAFRVETFSSDHVFMREGDHADAMHLMLDGEVEVKRRRKSKAGYALVTKKHRGDIFGLTSLINNDRRAATAVATGQVTVASLPKSAFELLYDTHAPIALHFQRLIAQQLARELRLYDEALRTASRSGDINEMASSLSASARTEP